MLDEKYRTAEHAKSPITDSRLPGTTDREALIEEAKTSSAFDGEKVYYRQSPMQESIASTHYGSQKMTSKKHRRGQTMSERNGLREAAVSGQWLLKSDNILSRPKQSYPLQTKTGKTSLQSRQSRRKHTLKIDVTQS